MENSGKPKKSVLKFLFNLVLSAILFGGISSAVFLVVTGEHYEEKPKIGNITAPSVSDIDVETPDVSIDKTQGSDEKIEMGISPVDVSEMVSACEPSIVSVNNYVDEEDEYIEFNGVFKKYLKASGSGVILGQSVNSVMIATSLEVLKDTDMLTVTFCDGSEVFAEVKGCLDEYDTAIISVKFSDMRDTTIKAIKIATMGSSTTCVPGRMLVLLGRTKGYGQTVSVGYIGSVNYFNDKYDINLISTDITNTIGGAVFNSAGELVGLAMQLWDGVPVSGRGVVIPLDPLKERLLEIVSEDDTIETESSYLGISGVDIDEEYSSLFDMPKGVNVKSLYKDSPASKAGVRVGDILVGVNNTSIKNMRELTNFLGYTEPGTKVTLYVQRRIDGKYSETQIDVELDAASNAENYIEK